MSYKLDFKAYIPIVGTLSLGKFYETVIWPTMLYGHTLKKKKTMLCGIKCWVLKK